MIKIQERNTVKLPGITSLFISFNYNQTIIEAVKLCFDSYFYDKKTYTWEVSIKGLSLFLDKVCLIDDIELDILEDKEDTFIEYDDLIEYKTKPFQYQIDAIQYGLNKDCFLLLDAPGLGKTLTSIYLSEELRERENISHCLIVCGINTLKHNWKKEIERHSDLDCRILGTRNFKKREGTYIGSIQDRLDDLKSDIKEFFVITNVETLRNVQILKEFNNGKNKFDIVIVDELHKCKSHQSQQGKHLLKLTSAKHRIGLTGTVLLNSPLDAYVPLKWIGAERSNFTNYKYFYCNFDGLFGNYVVGYKNIDVLKNQLEKYSLRRTKDILELPPKNIIHEFVDMDDSQKIFYDNIVNGQLDQVDRVHISNDSLLSIVTRLLQASSCPQVLTTENIKSTKVERAIDIALQILDNDEKVVIFSKFKPTLNPIMEALKDYNPLLCTGDIKDEIISQNIDSFQNNSYNRVMCCSISKMGTGITLTRASYAIFIDCSWTAAENTQCEDRIYRIGSKSPVFIYYLWTNDTFDVHVKEIVDDKNMISDYVVDDKLPPNLIDRLRQKIIDL